MKVKELIAQLALCDPEATVVTWRDPGNVYGDIFIAEDDIAYRKTLMGRSFMMRLGNGEVPEEEEIKIIRLGSC